MERDSTKYERAARISDSTIPAERGSARRLAEPDPLPISEERWSELMTYLREIPASERPRWRLAPPEMNYADAHRWARDVVHTDKVIRLSTGETMVRLPGEAVSPWGL